MKLLLTFCLSLLSVCLFAQWKDYRLTAKGDTLNRIDMKGLKQGPWLIRTPAKYGNPDMDEEGFFEDDKKEGTWRIFNKMGDPIAVENYKWGNKNGRCQYFNYAGLVREESWRAVNPANAFDTVDVIDPITEAVTVVIVKNEGRSVKHGVWKSFDPTTGRLQSSEEYFLDKIKDPLEDIALNTSDSISKKPVAKTKPQTVLDYEKKNAKKKHKVRTGGTGL